MGFNTLSIGGGLDLKSSPIDVQGGRFQNCKNVEVAYVRGARRMDGYDRFDGGPSPSFARYWAMNVNAIAAGDPWTRMNTNFWAGAILSIPYESPKNPSLSLEVSVIHTVTLGVTTGTIYFVTNSAADSELLGLLLSTQQSGYELVGSSATVTKCSLDVCIGETYTYANIENPEENTSLAIPTVTALRAAATAYYDATRPEIQEVPGQGSVIGLYWLKDYLYAVRDYLTLRMDDGSALVNPGDIVYQGASLGTATFSGEVISFTTDPTTANPNSALIMLANTAGIATIGALANDTTGVTAGNVEALSASAPGAGLYKAVGTRGGSVATQSWQHQDLGYSIEYMDGVEDFPILNRLRANSDKAPVTQTTQWFVADGDGLPATTWRDETGTLISAGNPAYPHLTNPLDGDTTFVEQQIVGTTGPSVPAYTTLWINNFGITSVDIPLSSVITGLEFEVTRRCYRPAPLVAGEVRDYQIEVKFADGSGGVQAGYNDINWPRSSTTPDNPNYASVTYGGETNTLGYSIGPSDLIGADFGIRFRPQGVGIASTTTLSARISCIRFRAHYIPPQGRVYFWNGTSGVVAEVVQYYKKSGAIDLGNAAGVMYLVNIDLTRQITTGEEIRSYPGDGVTLDGGVADNSTLLAMTGTALQRNVLDSSAALAANKSKYQGFVANFSVSAGFEAIYGVSGAGPAFMYDGQAFSRIFTGLSDQDEKPRHAMPLQSRAMLGYEAGVVNFSSPGMPLTFDFTNFAGELGIGSPVRGMYPLNGDSGAVFTQSGVSYVKGDLSTGPYASTISPDVGCVEFTAHSMGQYLYTSFRGCQNLRATSAYGDFDTSQFSEDVWSWLRPRVQASESFQSGNIACINAVPVRNKQQYRLFFADGWALTSTFLDAGAPPEYTFQHYVKNDGVTPRTWDVTCAGVESTGRDRIFGAMNDGTGYVFELDVGTSFDGAPIDWFARLVVDDQKAPYLAKDFSDIQVHGVAQDYASFSMTRSVNYEAPYPGAAIPHSFGSATAFPTGEDAYYMSASETRIAGRNLVVQFQGSSRSQPPFTIQAISYNFTPMSDKRT